MQINYMRIAIYVLTFITYAYSGYGSNIIHNLRDAIIAAEAVFGDVFKNVIHVARKFQTVHQIFDAAVEENCVYQCHGGNVYIFHGKVKRSCHAYFFTHLFCYRCYTTAK